MSAVREDVVLLDSGGRQVGTAAKATVHHRRTPLHLAFSSYVVRDGAVLLTRRAHTKRTWPGVLTNSCCGHPLPGEPLIDAVSRRLRDELGIDAVAVDLVLPRFRYRARMTDGTVENEMCPVFRVVASGAPRPDPAEVAWTDWVPWSRLRTGVADGSLPVSPWCRAQVAELNRLGLDPADWPVADPGLLPPAAMLPEPAR